MSQLTLLTNPRTTFPPKPIASCIKKDLLTHIELTVIVPAHNEEQIIREQTESLLDSIQEITEAFELLFVENGSIDNTLNEIKNLKKDHPQIHFIILRKADYSNAIIEGIKAARGDFTIVTGIDYSDPNIVKQCFHALADADVIICSKNKGVDRRPLINRLANRCYNVLVKLIFNEEFSDVEGYHGYKTSKIQPLVKDVKTREHLCNLWILLKARKAGLVIREIPLIVYERRKSKFMSYNRLPYLTFISILELFKLKRKGY